VVGVTLTRIQDDHIADAAQTEQVWTAGGWAKRFRLPFDSSATGYGHSTDHVAAVQVRSGDLLTGYHDVVHDTTIKYVVRLPTATSRASSTIRGIRQCLLVSDSSVCSATISNDMSGRPRSLERQQGSR
jgi:hypothetical protein